MVEALPLLAILGAVALGAMSPGPSFVYVSRLAVARSRRHGFAAALGMGLASVLFAVAAVAGLGALLHYVEWAYIVLKIAGGAYLVYLGISLWRHAGSVSSSTDQEVRPGRAVVGGLLAQLSNPKAAVVYGSIFATLLPATPPVWMLVAIPVGVFTIETGWYFLVALAFSTRRPRELYLRSARWVDRAAGAVLGVLGATFAFDGVRTALR